MSDLEKVLIAVGVLTIIVIVFFVIILSFYAIKELVEVAKIKYIQKHRFDKPPTAKCYCKDCKSWNESDGRCRRFETWHTADCWFCWDAEPRTK